MAVGNLTEFLQDAFGKRLEPVKQPVFIKEMGWTVPPGYAYQCCYVCGNELKFSEPKPIQENGKPYENLGDCKPCSDQEWFK